MKTKIFTLFLAIVASVGTMYSDVIHYAEIDEIWYMLDESQLTAEVISTHTVDDGRVHYEYGGDMSIPSSVTYMEKTYSVTSIGQSAFFRCTYLTSISIPNSVTSIKGGAFSGCTGLTSMTIPNSVSSIGSGAFEGCTGLTSISVNALNTSYVDIDGVLFKKDKTTIIAYPCGKQGAYTIIPSVTSIEDEAFYGCSGLTSVTIPNSVTSIGLYAFYGCTGLESLTLLNTTFLMIDGEAFSYCTGLKEITCMAMQPPCADNHFIFDGVSLSIPLYVPLSSISLNSLTRDSSL